MTKKNLIILNKLRQEVQTDYRKILFLVKAPQIARINLAILRICLTERKERGIYISIDKPDKHVRQILERHNISKEGSYVDTGISSSTGQHQQIKPPTGSKKVLVVSGIFCPTLFLDSIDATMASSPEAKDRILKELGGMDFLMIDNLSTMTIYNSQKKIEEFFERFDSFFQRFPNLRIFMSTDKSVQKEVYQLARKATEHEVDILDEWL
jgi:hypothetical protein